MLSDPTKGTINLWKLLDDKKLHLYVFGKNNQINLSNCAWTLSNKKTNNPLLGWISRGALIGELESFAGSLWENGGG